jgi:hypothetical protein
MLIVLTLLRQGLDIRVNVTQDTMVIVCRMVVQLVFEFRVGKINMFGTINAKTVSREKQGHQPPQFINTKITWRQKIQKRRCKLVLGVLKTTSGTGRYAPHAILVVERIPVKPVVRAYLRQVVLKLCALITNMF